MHQDSLPGSRSHKRQIQTPQFPEPQALHTHGQTFKYPLILSPSVPTSHALEEAGHGFIRTSNLHLEKCSLVAVAAFGRTLRAALLRIIPRARPAKDVLLFLALKYAAREDGLGDGVLKRTGAALEAVGALVCEGHGEDVGALRADYITISILG